MKNCKYHSAKKAKCYNFFIFALFSFTLAFIGKYRGIFKFAGKIDARKRL